MRKREPVPLRIVWEEAKEQPLVVR